jgi:hypothetical protein
VPGPKPKYQALVGDLFLSLRNYLRSQTIGGVLIYVEFTLDPNIRVRPDVAVLLKEK